MLFNNVFIKQGAQETDISYINWLVVLNYESSVSYLRKKMLLLTRYVSIIEISQVESIWEIMTHAAHVIIYVGKM